MSDAWSIFDIIGPVMVGPSSSHTAGACRLGYFAQKIHGRPFQKVKIELHGSFAEVAEGHGTDTALVGGLLGLLPSDARIIHSFALAKEAGVEFSFCKKNLGAERHPNTVRFFFPENTLPQVITGSSVGGGRAEITEIDKIPTHIDGAYSCLLLEFEAKNGILNKILPEIFKENITIVHTKTEDYKDRTLLIVEIKESTFPQEKIQTLEKIPEILWVRFLRHISHYSE